MNDVLSESEGRELFPRIKPLCVQVMSSPSLETLTKMREGLFSVLGSRALHPQMIDYVLLPVRMVINKCGSTNLRLLEGGLETLDTVLAHVRGLDNWELFNNLLVFLCMLLDSKMAKEAGFTERSEDLVLVCVRALRTLLLCPSASARQLLFSNLPAVGHCVSVLLETLQSFTSKTLRQHALAALLALSGINENSLTLLLSNTEVKNSPQIDQISSGDGCNKYLDGLVDTLGVGPEDCGHVFACFLPGITMVITKLVTSETNLGSSVTVLSLLTWAHYVALVMKDSECSTPEIEASKGSNYDKVSEDDLSRKKLEVQRSLSWQQETDSKLCVLVQRMSGLVTSESWRSRLGLVGWAHILLSHSYRTLTTSIPHLLESLVTLSHDDYPFISNSAHHAIATFSHRYDSDQSDTKLTSLLEGRVHSLCSALPRLMRQNDDKRKVTTLQLLSGYLQLLGSHVTALTHSHAHLSRLVMALVQTLEVQVSDTRIMEQPVIQDSLIMTTTNSSPLCTPSQPPTKRSSSGSNSNTPALSKIALHFVHFREERIETLLYSVCQLLGRYGNLQVVVDHLMDLYRSSEGQRKELLIILSRVLTGAKTAQTETSHLLSSDELYPLVESMVLEFVETVAPGHTRPSKELWTEEQPSKHQDSVLQSCLLLNTILACARILETKFDPLLQQLAYPLLQWLGDSDIGVSAYARGVIHSIATLCQYRSIQKLISGNADYLVNSTALNLRSPSSLDHHLRATHVLRAILTHGDEDVLPLMRDSLDELLFSLDARRQSPTHIWPTLHSLSENCLRWSSGQPSLPPTNSRNEKNILENLSIKETDTPQAQTSPDDIKQFFFNYHRQKEANKNDSEESEEKVGESEEDDPYMQKRELAPVTRAILSVMQRCAHHLSSPTQQVRLLALEALANAINALKYDQTTLLPEMHDVWSPFLPRLSDPAPPVAVRAWRVMLVMCEVCGEFLRKRVVAKVWPPLVKSLESLALKSVNAEPLYRQSSQYKLQQCLLSCVSTLCLKLAVPSSDMETLARSSLLYLSADQPQGLQDTCLACFCNMIAYDSDVVWLLLQQLCPHTVLSPTHSTLKPYTFKQFITSDKFFVNVQKLILLC